MGDIVRMTVSTTAAREGEEGRVLSIRRDENDVVVAMDIFIDGEPARTRGTTVFAYEVERVIQVNE